MSYITSVVVVGNFSSETQERLATTPVGLLGDRLARIDMSRAGGTKVFGGDVFAGAFNYLDRDSFAGWLVEILRGDPSAFVWMDTEGDLAIYQPNEEHMTQVLLADG